MIKKYFKDKFKLILLFILFLLIFVIVFWLYNLPMEAVLYGALLCSVMGVIVIINDYVKFRKKHIELTRLMNCINISIDELPISKNSIESHYEILIKKLFEYNRSLISTGDIEKTEMIDFYTLWVHQIKTPIAAMSLLLQESEGEEKKKLLQELFKIERYVEMVLQYLRLGSLSGDLKLERYGLEEIVKQAIKKYASMFIHKKIKLEINNFDIKVLSDEKWLTFVIEQLISNALKYTNEGSIKIYIEKEKILVIEDTGIGISEEDLPRVFEKGFTGFNGRMDKKATGLGLYLTRKILDKLNHKIEITSREGVGSKVSIYLDNVEFVAYS